MIKINRDDVGLQSLIRQNKATIDLEGDVEDIEPYPGIREGTPRLPPERPPRSRDRRRYTAQSDRQQRGPDRRRTQRRMKDSSVLLDTRARHDRRSQLRRNDDLRQKDNDIKPSQGLDEFA